MDEVDDRIDDAHCRADPKEKPESDRGPHDVECDTGGLTSILETIDHVAAINNLVHLTLPILSCEEDPPRREQTPTTDPKDRQDHEQTKNCEDLPRPLWRRGDHVPRRYITIPHHVIRLRRVREQQE